MMVEAQDIYKSFGEIAVLKGINLKVEKGEVISIVGASGAGKTTLLQILGTLDSSDKGSIEINGQNPSKLKSAQLARFRNQHIGFVFQFHHLLPEFTGMENVCIPGFIAGIEQKEVEKKAKELIGFLGLDKVAGKKPAQLSGGEQQRLAVARALINRPDIILADEPSGNLDSKNSKELHQLFFNLRDEFNQTFILVTHNEQLANMADRKITIQDGVIL
ncbi:MAG TPA: ABC transporter ATP-binding protein [Bacteroidales bacterium]|nr:ABC transporter ATP-binding protein [Bacteroidales bacterium]